MVFLFLFLDLQQKLRFDKFIDLFTGKINKWCERFHGYVYIYLALIFPKKILLLNLDRKV